MEGEYFKSPGHHVYDGIIYTVGFDAPVLDRIRNADPFQLHAEDVLIASYPKAGTSWMQVIVSLIYNAEDIEAAEQTDIDNRVPFLEFTGRGQMPLLDDIETRQPPRLLKTHLPARFFSKHKNVVGKNTKVIFSMRNPKDTLVSYYHFYRMNDYFGCFTGTWSEFFQLFLDNHLGLGNWFDMVLEWWAYRETYNILFVKYEHLKKDLRSGIQRIADYLGKTLTEEQLDVIVQKTTFNQMKATKIDMDGLNFDISPFMRKGAVGDWKNYFTAEQNTCFDKLYAEKMAGSGLEFDFVL